MVAEYIPKIALFVYAHPDDIEYAAGGTAAKWANKGSIIHFLIVTNGCGSSQSLSQEKTEKLRKTEQFNAARIIGAETVTFLDYRDGEVVPDINLRKAIVKKIRELRPNVIVTSDPEPIIISDTYIGHPDHRAVSLATVEASFPAPKSPNIFPEHLKEGFKTHKPDFIYISAPKNNRNLFINIENTLDIKINSLLAHKSQYDESIRQKIISWAQSTGEEAGLNYAEAFRRISLG